MIQSGDLFQLMTDQLQTWGVHLVTINDIRTEGDDIDQGFRAHVGLHAWYNRFADHVEQNTTPGTLLLYEDELRMIYSVYVVPEHLVGDCGCRYLIIGPTLFKVPTEQSVAETIQRIGGDPRYLQEFMEFYNQACLFGSTQGWITNLLFYLRRICSDPPVNLVQIADTEQGYVADQDYRIPETPNTALNVIEERYKGENAMMEAVSAGNYDQALDRLSDFHRFRFTPRQADQLRDRKNFIIIFNTLMRKAAEYGGVHPVHVDNLSHQFALAIEKASSIQQLEQLQVVMIRKYCLLVQNYARNSYPALVQNCMNAIDFYYNSDLSLSRLAKLCNVSESHLSAAFKKATGSTVTDYINRTRVHQALLLLNSSSLSVSEIAARCGFDDANYFSRVFRKLQGMSPREYRGMIQG